jgi:hypothetical protein
MTFRVFSYFFFSPHVQIHVMTVKDNLDAIQRLPSTRKHWVSRGSPRDTSIHLDGHIIAVGRRALTRTARAHH